MSAQSRALDQDSLQVADEGALMASTSVFVLEPGEGPREFTLEMCTARAFGPHRPRTSDAHQRKGKVHAMVERICGAKGAEGEGPRRVGAIARRVERHGQGTAARCRFSCKQRYAASSLAPRAHFRL